MKAYIIAPLEEKMDLVVKHANEVKESIQQIFKTTDPDIDVQYWYTHNPQNLNDLAIAVVVVKDASLIYFCKGWEKYQDAKVIHYICELYGIQRMEE